MPTVPLIALKRFTHGRRRLNPGDRFDGDSTVVHAFITTGLARKADATPAPEPVSITASVDLDQAREVFNDTAAAYGGTPPGPLAAPAKKKRGRPRKYQRKDLEAGE